MSLDIKIKQKGLFKKKLTLSDILMNQFQYGRYDNNYVLIPNEKLDSELTLFHPEHIARGISVIWNENETKEIGLNMLYPTTNKEIDDLYQLVRYYCQCYKTDVFEQDGVQLHLSDIDKEKEKIKKFNLETYHGFLNEHDTGCFFCAMWPYFYDEQTKEKWLNDLTLETFETDLHQQQSLDLYYTNPRFYSVDKDGKKQVMGVYTITSTVESVFPLVPKTPLCYQDFTSKDEVKADFYAVALFSLESEEMLITISFDDFMKELNKRELHEFDGEHIYFDGFSEEELYEISEKYESII
ncbi:MAG: DUF4299 family protein [Coprobacillus sp.]